MTNMKCPSLSLLNDFSLKSILLGIRTAILACFLGPFDYIFFQTLYSEAMSVCRLRHVSCMQQKDRFCFHIQSVSQCLFIGELSPFVLRDINDQ